MLSLRSSAALIAILQLLLADPASARGRGAKALLAKGNRAFAAGDYQAAYEAFSKGNEKSPSPVFLRSMAFCKLKLYKHKEARKLLQEYLKKYPKQKDKDKIGTTVKNLDEVVQTKLLISSTPPGAKVFIDAEATGSVGVTAAQPLEITIEPGTHTIILRKDGFHTTTKTLTIVARKSHPLSVPLELPFSVSSTPSGATVHLDSADAKPLGKTPLRDAGITPGAHTVFVKASGYKTYEQKLTVANQPVSLDNIILVLGMTISSTPPGASVSLDGTQVAGVTPVNIAVKPGKHSIAVNLEGYKAYTKEVDVQPGADASFTATLQGGLLNMRTSTPGAVVTIGGRELGKTPLDNVNVPLGSRKVTLTHPDRRPWEKAIDFNESEMITAKVKLGRKSWPFWALVGTSAAAAIAGGALGIVKLSTSASNNDADRYSLEDGTPVLDVNQKPIKGLCDGTTMVGKKADGTEPSCGYGMHHASTGLLAGAGAAAVGALFYYLFAMRPSETIERLPRGEAESAKAAKLGF